VTDEARISRPRRGSASRIVVFTRRNMAFTPRGILTRPREPSRQGLCLRRPGGLVAFSTRRPSGRPDLKGRRRQCSIWCRASARVRNQLTERHSSRSRPLKLSINAFSTPRPDQPSSSNAPAPFRAIDTLFFFAASAPIRALQFRAPPSRNGGGFRICAGWTGTPARLSHIKFFCCARFPLSRAPAPCAADRPPVNTPCFHPARSAHVEQRPQELEQLVHDRRLFPCSSLQLSLAV
jgi:hypothetical protein